MPTFRCKIATSDGGLVHRVISAETLDVVKKKLARDGHHLLHAHKETGDNSFFSFRPRVRVSSRDFYTFNQQFSVLLKAGLPVVVVLDSILYQRKKKDGFYNILKTVRQEIASGASVSEAFKNYARFFSPFYIASLQAGEAGGDLPGAIFRYLNYARKTEALKQKVKSASIYPAILSVCSLFVVIFLVLFVVPAITGTFAETGKQMPFITRMLLGVSDFVSSRYLTISLALGLICLSGIFIWKWERGRMFLDRQILKIPEIGPFTGAYAMARFAATLSTLLASGIPLKNALSISVDVVGNRYLKDVVLTAADAVEQGAGFAESLEKSGVFPGMAVSMISAGEEGGSLETVLMEVAEFYDTDVENRLILLTSFIEPFLMVIMGVIIGFIVIAMYMPIFQMAGTIG